MATCAVKDLKPGMKVDLEADPYADPEHDNTLLKNELQVVVELDVETPQCICVYFDNFACGFPPEHNVTVEN